MPAAFYNPLLLVTWIVLGVVPAIYLNKYLLKLVRPRESAWRFLAYCIIFGAFTLVYTTVMIWLMRWTIFKPEAY